MSTWASIEQRRLAAVVERASNAVVITDPAGQIEWVNDAFTRLTGYPAAAVIRSSAWPARDPVRQRHRGRRAGQVQGGRRRRSGLPH